ncbi:MAG: hypothetical protein ACOC3Z_00630 [Nanoarchaeota archaeon]
MSNTINELSNYILKNIKKNYSMNSLKVALIKQGYSRALVEKAIEKAETELSKKNTESNKERKPKIKYSLFDENNRVIRTEYFPKKSFWKKIFKK